MRRAGSRISKSLTEHGFGIASSARLIFQIRPQYGASPCTTGMTQPIGLERVTMNSVTSQFARYPSRRGIRHEGGRRGPRLNNELDGENYARPSDDGDSDQRDRYHAF